MNTGFVIQWKNQINGRAGRGSKVFSYEEAQQVAADLNAGYPDIEHEVIPSHAPDPDPLNMTAEPGPTLVSQLAESEVEEEEPEDEEPSALQDDSLDRHYPTTRR